MKDTEITPDAIRVDRMDYIWFKWNNVREVNSIKEVGYVFLIRFSNLNYKLIGPKNLSKGFIDLFQ